MSGPTLVFTRRRVRLPPAARWSMGLAGLAVCLLGWRLYQLFPAERWRDAFDRLAGQGGLWSKAPLWEAVVWLLASIGVIWLQWHQQRRSRLRLDERTLRLDSGVPLLRRWLDWSLSLDDVRAGKTPLLLNGVAVGTNALWMFRIGWGLSALRQVQPAAWVLAEPGDALPPPGPVGEADARPPHRPLGYIGWGHPDNAAWLQRQFDALPLVKALRSHGVDVPPLNRAHGNRAGVDLLRYERLRTSLKLWLPMALVIGMALQHLARHQHYFAPWSMAMWSALALTLALLVGIWLWRDAPATSMSRGDAGSVRGAQCLVALLLAILMPWGLQAAPLVLARWTVPPLSEDFVLDLSSGRLKPENPILNGHDIRLDPAASAFWAAQPDGSIHPLPLRRGWGGLWLQYDTEDLNGRIARFYDQQQRGPASIAGSRRTDI